MKTVTPPWYKRLPNFFSRHAVQASPELQRSETPELRLLSVFLFIFWILLGLFVFTMFFFDLIFKLTFPFSHVDEVISGLLGVKNSEQQNTKFEILKFLGVAMGGTLVALQAFASYKRSIAMENTAQAQIEANRNTERGQLQERLRSAMDHFGHQSVSVRLGGAYELVNLAQDNPDFQQTVLDILCAYIRSATAVREYQHHYSSKPSAEIQNLLHLLFRKKHEVFNGLHIDLEECWLNGADLRDARLTKAILRGAYLRGVDLWRARLQGAVLPDAQLQGASLLTTRLQGADLRQAGFQGADLAAAQLHGALLWGVGFQGAVFVYTEFRGARGSLKSEGPSIVEELAFQELSFADRMRAGVGYRTNLSETIFAGGLAESEVDDFVVGLPDEKAAALRDSLKIHVDQPSSYRTPETDHIIFGAYTKEEAEEWIAETDRN